MSSNPLRVVLAAEESAGGQALRLLLSAGCEIPAVIATPDSRTNGLASVASLARQRNLNIWPAEGLRDGRYAAAIRDARADLLLNVHALHRIHADVLAAPRLGAFNLHPSPLPRYAGLNSVSWALYRGEPMHGVTLHRMLPTIDTGDIAFQSVFAVSDDDTALSLYGKCGRIGLELVQRLLEAATSDAIPAVAQDLSRREFFRRSQIPQDGMIEWDRPAREVANFVRACDYHPFPSPWSYPRALRDGREIAIARARRVAESTDAPPGTVVRVVSNGCEVACRDELIRVERIEVEGRSLNPAGLIRVGDRLGNGGDTGCAAGFAAARMS